MSLIEDLEEGDWFWTPSTVLSTDLGQQLESDGGSAGSNFVTHIAWQIGHLAFAQYGLLLYRQRGRRREDAELMSTRFRKQFGKGSSPAADPTIYPSISEIRATFAKIYEQSLKEIPAISEESLDEPVDPPHAAFATRYGCLMFAAHHEMLHAGQIGLLRRLMGKSPLR